MPIGLPEPSRHESASIKPLTQLLEPLPVSEVFCPAGISSFFEVCRTDGAGNELTDPTRIGARGGGFVIARGVTSQVTVRKRHRTRIEIRINSRPAPNARTTRSAIEQIVNTSGQPLEVTVRNQVEVPIAAGFGTSAAGTLAACLALTDAGDLPMTLNEVGMAAHVAEVLNGTGLGTVSALLCGGFVLVRQPGGPGIGLIDRLRFPTDHSIVCAYLGPIQTRDVLAAKADRTIESIPRRETLEAISKTPTLPVFLAESRRFGKQAGFETSRITRLISTLMSAGALGAAQNMIGEAVHAVVHNSKTTRTLKVVKAAFPESKVFATDIEGQGVRFLNDKAKH